MGADCKPDGAHRQPDARSEEEQGGKSGRFQPVYSERKGLPESATFRSAGRLCQKVIFCLFFRQKQAENLSSGQKQSGKSQLWNSGDFLF